jgi:hypothetical protein
MGKLAERLSDPRRSGVYRLIASEALEEAVALNRFALTRFALSAVPAAALPALAADAVSRDADGQVLLFSGFEPLARAAPAAFDAFLGVLQAAAGGRRSQGLRFFAAFLDPAETLSLEQLYHWQRARSAL